MSIGRLLFRLAGRLSQRLPVSWIEGLSLTMINARLERLSAPEGLRLLFRLDARLYEAQSRTAVIYEGGTHPKHRLTAYHDFFVDRIGFGERVLDVGCGQGQLAHSLAIRAQAKVVGIDLSQNNIEIARASYQLPDLNFYVGNVLEALPGGPFDVVVMSNVLEHLSDRPHFLSRLMSVSGAKRILLRVPMFERDWRVPLKRELGVEWRTDPTHLTEHSCEQFAAELDEAGLVISEEVLRWGEIWAVARPRV